MSADLKSRREQLGLSQAALARRLNVAPNTIARWERGELAIKHAGMLDLALRQLNRERQEVEGRRSTRVERERTRTRVVNGWQVWVIVRNAMAFGNRLDPGVRIVALPTDEASTDSWQVVGIGNVPGTDPWDWAEGRLDGLRARDYPATEIPGFHEEMRKDVRNKIGGYGAVVAVWPEESEMQNWLNLKITELIDSDVDKEHKS